MILHHVCSQVTASCCLGMGLVCHKGESGNGARAVDQFTETRPRADLILPLLLTASDGQLGGSDPRDSPDQASIPGPHLRCSVVASWVGRPGSEVSQGPQAEKQGLVLSCGRGQLPFARDGRLHLLVTPV